MDFAEIWTEGVELIGKMLKFKMTSILKYISVYRPIGVWRDLLNF